MRFFDEYTIGIQEYADAHVSIENVNLIVPGSVLNVAEVGSFDVQLRNNGPLRMADVTVRIRCRRHPCRSATCSRSPSRTGRLCSTTSTSRTPTDQWPSMRSTATIAVA